MQLSFSFMVFVGLIALTGIVVNDTIVMIEVMNGHRARGASVQEAAARGAADRLRPILTTSVTTILGMLPLALGQGMWVPLATTVIGGLLFATVLALLVVPCLFFVFTFERAESGGPRIYLLPAGFYGVTRPVRLADPGRDRR